MYVSEIQRKGELRAVLQIQVRIYDLMYNNIGSCVFMNMGCHVEMHRIL